MKALSIRQPWAEAIVSGHKPVENRTWSTKFRGEFLVHASSRLDKAAIAFCETRGTGVLKADELVLGAIIGKVELYDVVTELKSPWFFGPYGFLFRNPIRFPEPIPCKGKLGFFEVKF